MYKFIDFGMDIYPERKQRIEDKVDSLIKRNIIKPLYNIESYNNGFNLFVFEENNKNQILSEVKLTLNDDICIIDFKEEVNIILTDVMDVIVLENPDSENRIEIDMDVIKAELNKNYNDLFSKTEIEKYFNSDTKMISHLISKSVVKCVKIFMETMYGYGCR